MAGADTLAPAIGVTALLSVCTLVVYKNHRFAWTNTRTGFRAGYLPREALPDSGLRNLSIGSCRRGFRGLPEGLDIHRGGHVGILSGLCAGAGAVCVPRGSLALQSGAVGATLLLLAYIARTLFGSSTPAGWIMLFAIASPVFLINGISYYSSQGSCC